MKRCSKCGIEKNESEFHSSKNHKDGLYPSCKECRRNDWRAYYKENANLIGDKTKAYREKHSEEIHEYQRSWRDEYSNFLFSLKTPCVKCGESRRYVIDFHHISPDEKSFNISGLNRNRDLVAAEVKKCVSLCRNCHAEFHYIYGTKPEKPVESLTEYLGRNPYEI